MKKIYLLILMGFYISSFGQVSHINQVTATTVTGGINVNLKVSSPSSAGFLSYTYLVSGNVINLSVCYAFGFATVVTYLNNDFFIPVANNTTYVINIRVTNSSSSITCNNYSAGPSTILNFLNNNSFEMLKLNYQLSPNPSKGLLSFKDNELQYKEVSFFDLMGRRIKTFNQKMESFDISDLNNGTYIAKIETDFGAFSQKIILDK